MMQTLCYLAFTLLCSLSFLSPVLSIQCNETQYPWPSENSHFCCNMCHPGEYMASRHQSICKSDCQPCIGKRYRDTYSTKMDCNFCDNCERPNMEYELNCTATRNAVCRCKAGYEWKDQSCTECVPIPTTPTPTLPTATAETQWFLVIIAILAAGIAFVLVTKIKPFLRWIRSKHGYILAKPPAPVLPCSVDEEVSKPVQEVCGKCDKRLDV